MGLTILAVDDDPNALTSLKMLLELKGWAVSPHLSGNDALRNLDGLQPAAAIVDYYLGDMDGVQCMKKLHEKFPGLPVIILTASREVETAVDALKAGAFHYLVKGRDDVQADELYSTLDKIAGQKKLEEENRRLKRELSERYGFDNIIGRSGALQEVCGLLSKAVGTKSTILITGESGTGKELFARAAHFNSPRSEGPFIKVNCAAIPETMLEAELFGIEKNVATGVGQRPGKFELADGGSIFLDEIGDMSAATQAKVLRVLQEKEVERLGAAAPTRVDIRVIAATNKNLEKAVEDGEFRQDLYYRLNVFHLSIPPLRERRDDIPLLAEHFISKYSEENGIPEAPLTPQATDYLMNREWPGNIRELENTVERAVAVAEGEAITVEDLEPAAGFAGNRKAEAVTGDTLEDKVAEFERGLIEKALEECGGKQKAAAEKLGISERSIWYKVKKLGINPKKG